MEEKIITKEFIKKEASWLVLTFVILLTIFKICFYKESFLVIARLVFSIFWLFILPGYSILLNYNLDFIERIIFGSAVGMAIYTIISYPLGLIGINVRYHLIMIPIIIISISLIIFYKKSMSDNKLSEQ